MPKIKDCLNARSKIKDSFTKKEHESSSPAPVDRVLKSLYAERKSLLTAAPKELGDASTKLTMSDEVDPDNRISKFKPKNKTNLLTQVGDFLQTLRDILTSKKSEYTGKQKAVIREVGVFVKEFVRDGIDVTFLAKTASQLNWRFQDYTQYLTEFVDGDDRPVLHEKVKQAIALSAYKFLATDAMRTLNNTDSDMRAIMQIGSNDIITVAMKEVLSTLGTSSGYLVQLLGQEAYRNLRINEGNDSNVGDKERLIASLGIHAVLALEQMGYIERNTVFMGSSVPGKESGLLGLKHNVNHNVLVPKDVTNLKGTSVTEFFRVKTVLEKAPSSMQAFTKGPIEVLAPELRSKTSAYKDDPDALDTVLNGEPTSASFTFEKPSKRTSEYPVKRTPFTTTSEQTRDIDKYSAQGWVLDKSMAMLYFLLGDQRGKIVGTKETGEELDVRKEHVNGKNLGLHTEHKNFLDYFKRAVGKLDQPIFIPSEVWKQGRLGMRSTIDPLSSKIHRWLFHKEEATTTFKKSNKAAHQRFIKAIGVGLGIESNHVGGTKNAIALTEEKLAEPLFHDAIQFLAAMDFEYDLDTLDSETLAKLQDTHQAELSVIIQAILAGKEKLHSAKALLEYAKYMNAKESFTTSMKIELDGVNNGPAIGMWQTLSNRVLGLDSDGELVNTNKLVKVLSFLANAGSDFLDRNTSLDIRLSKKTTLDAYERMGHSLAAIRNEWALGKIGIAKNGNKREANFAKNDLQRMQIVKRMMGENLADENGYLNKFVRKLSKDPTMTTWYGVGKKKLTQRYADEFIDNHFYDKLHDIIIADDVDALRSLINDVNRLAKPWAKDVDLQKAGLVDPTGRLNRNAVRKIKLNPETVRKINSHFKYVEGEILYSAVEAEYGTQMAEMQKMNKAMQVSTAIYNVLLQDRIDSAVANKAYVNDTEHQRHTVEGVAALTVSEFNQIKEDLLELLPSVKTAYHTENSATQEGKIFVGKYDKQRMYTAKSATESGANEVIVTPDKDSKVSQLKVPVKLQYLLKDTGAAPGVLLTQNVDSVVATKSIAEDGIAALNVHDGFLVPPGQEASMEQTLNKNYHNTLTNFDAAQRTFDMLKNSLQAYQTKPVQEALLVRLFDEYGLFPPSIKKPTYSDAMAVIQQTNDSIHKLAKESAANKQVIQKAVTHEAQYSGGTRGFKTGNKQAKSIFGFDPANLNTEAVADVETRAKDIKESSEAIAKEGFDSGNKEWEIPTNKDEFTQHHELEQASVVSVYHQRKNDSTVKDSAKHDKHLTRLLTEVAQKVMDPISIYFMDNPEVEAQGKYVYDPKHPEREAIFVSNQTPIGMGPISEALTSGLRMSTGEVMSHEIIHKIVAYGLRNAPAHLKRYTSTMYKLSEKHFNELHDGNGWKVFLNDTDIDITDPANKIDVADAKARWDKIFNPESINRGEYVEYNSVTKEKKLRTDSHALDEFLALGLTNENFYDALVQLTVPKKKNPRIKELLKSFKGQNGQEILVTIFNIVTDFVQGKLHRGIQGENVGQALEALVVQLGNVDKENKSALAKTMSLAEKYTQMVLDAGDAGIRAPFLYVGETRAWESVKKAADKVSRDLKDSDTVLGQKYREISILQEQADRSLTASAWDEIKGLTDRVKPLHELNSRRNLILDRARQAAATHLADNLMRSYSKIEEQRGELTDHDKTAVTRVLIKTDIQTLMDKMSMDDILHLLKDQKAVEQRIASLENSLRRNPELSKARHYLRKGAQALGYYITTDRNISKDAVTFSNASIIASLQNTHLEGSLSETSEGVAKDIVDELATLYAIKYTPKRLRDKVAGFGDIDQKAISDTLIQHGKLKSDAVKSMFNGAEKHFIKGYTKPDYDPHIILEYGTKEDADHFKTFGYAPVGTVRKDADADHGEIVMYQGRTGKLNDMVSGIASMLSMKIKGTDLITIANQSGDTAKGSTKIKLFKRKQQTLDRMFSADPLVEDDSTGMIPVTDSEGNITQFRYVMSREGKTGILKQNEAFDTILGSMAGQIVEAEATPKINDDMVKELKIIHDKTFQDDPESFVRIAPDAMYQRHRDIYMMLPDSTKDTIASVWGGNTMYVPKDIINLAFGYKKLSATDALFQDRREKGRMEAFYVKVMQLALGDNAIPTAHRMESWATYMASAAKNNIVVKNIGVTGGNFESNLMYLKSKGLTNRYILKHGSRSVDEGIRYQADTAKLAELEYDRENLSKDQKVRAKNLDRKIIELKTALTNNPVTLFIESGGMPALVDDIDTEIASSKFKTIPEKAIERGMEKLSPKVRNAVEGLYLTNDRPTYKILNNGVKMTDYVARYILYNTYTDKGMSHSDAMAQVTEEFINFDLPTHKTLQYANDTGLLLFSKYQLRVLKQMANLAVDKPFTALTTFIIGSSIGFGNSVFRSIPGVTKGAFGMFSTPMVTLYQSLGDIFTVDAAQAVID